jgi:uncharacterized protein YjbI with pentapeptide repeats
MLYNKRGVKMNIEKILKEHSKWLNGKGGKKADLTGANLTEAELIDANLRRADLTGADLTGANLTGANLTEADLLWVNLRGADLTGANLRGANLRGADLTGANLRGANLRGADLTGADIDFSVWPLWCGSLNVKVDKKIAVQLMYHACAIDCGDYEYQEVRAKVLDFANQMHRKDVKRLE